MSIICAPSPYGPAPYVMEFDFSRRQVWYHFDTGSREPSICTIEQWQEVYRLRGKAVPAVDKDLLMDIGL